ncbi:MAG: hypothetical protein P1V97_16630, partial [Planctomycetota bacterium]|nr:hypothetical protein [Planctomycetota bacterium]
KYESQRPLIQEALPQAKAERDFVSYVRLLFITANSCNSTLTPVRQRDASVELITLLESTDAARRIQPDLSEEAFEELKHWYSSCAYDNLAIATANIEGFNSEGMFEAVTEGIEKCRQTGKTQCITCFREYSVLVSMAADDLELAAKQAHQLALRGKDEAQHDRRAVAWKDLGRIQILAGDLESSLQSFDQALAVAKEYHDPEDIELAVHRHFDLVYSLLARPEEYQEFCKTQPCPKLSDPDESRVAAKLQDHVMAVKACINKDFDTAIELRKKWIDWCTESQNLADWFDLQVMLISTLKLKDAASDVSDLIAETRSKAEEKRDWLTLKRLACIEHPEFTINPLGTIAPFLAGHYAAKDQDVEGAKSAEANKSEQSPNRNETPDGQSDEDTTVTPMMIMFQESTDRLQKASDQPSIIKELAAELKGIIPNTLENAKDASYYLRMLAWAFQLGFEVKPLWRLAKMVAKLYP